MPKRMKNMVINRVDLVDEGANPGAHIALFKHKGGEENTTIAEMAKEFAKSAAEEFKRFFGLAGKPPWLKPEDKEGEDGEKDEGKKKDGNGGKTKEPEGKKGVVKSMTFEDFLKSLTPEQQALVNGELQKRDTEIADLKKSAKPVEQTPEEFFKGWPAPARAAYEKLQADNKTNSEAIARMAMEKRNATFIEKAKGYTHLPVDASKLGEVLRKVADVDEADLAELEQVLQGANEIAKTAGLYAPIGKGTPVEGSAEGQLHAKAKEIRKSNGSLTPEQAFAQALRENPDLYNRYLEEEVE